MNSGTKTGMAVLVLVGAGLFCGCVTQQKPVSRMETRAIAFPNDISAPADMRVTDENDPKQVIAFAIGLAENGRHAQAARFFEEAAGKFCSEGNELAVNCRAAAANEYLLAGNADGFRKSIGELKREMNRFQAAAVDKQVATILALGEMANGANKPSALTPAAVRDLY